MAYEQRDNEGSLFTNDRKENDRQPDMTGKIMVGGVMYWISAWNKQGAKGDWISLALKPQEDRGGGSGQEQQRGGYSNRSQRTY